MNKNDSAELLEIGNIMFPSGRKKRSTLRKSIYELIVASRGLIETAAFGCFKSSLNMLHMQAKTPIDFSDVILAWTVARPSDVKSFVRMACDRDFEKNWNQGIILGALEAANRSRELLWFLNLLKVACKDNLYIDSDITPEVLGRLSQALSISLDCIWENTEKSIQCRIAIAEFFSVVDSKQTRGSISVTNLHDALIHELSAKVFLLAPIGRRVLIFQYGLQQAISFSLPVTWP